MRSHLDTHTCMPYLAAPDDRKFLSGIYGAIPDGFAEPLMHRYNAIHKKDGRRAANLYALELSDLFPAHKLNYAAEESEIEILAPKKAKTARERIASASNPGEAVTRLERLAQRYGISMPHCNEPGQIIARMSSVRWWKRALRKRFRNCESSAIQAGLVHSRAGCYVSDVAHNRRQSQIRRNARLLENLEAINDAGDVFSVAELASTNVSNPVNRFAELMTRIKGCEEYAKHKSYDCIFLTLTTPSRMHARLSGSMQPNPRYDGTPPRHAQNYLSKKVWARAQAKLDREGIQYLGVRVAEPHHDGTPHWHMLVFVQPHHKNQFISIVRSYSLRESPDEPGAQEHRFKHEQIDPTRGSAAGYIIKYISKNLTGANVGEDFEAGSDAESTAPRVETWASLWGIRQFQFFGTPSITPYRELRRLTSLPSNLSPHLEMLREAADQGDWCSFILLQEEMSERLKPLWETQQSATYPSESTKRIRGVRGSCNQGEFNVITRQTDWVIRVKGSDSQGNEQPNFSSTGCRISPPWTCVNNSTPPGFKGFQPNRGAREEKNSDFGEAGIFTPERMMPTVRSQWASGQVGNG